ncbi:MAG: hypothetical protein Q9183_003934, partial [Haloplaca sp. 2 TL-2023]
MALDERPTKASPSELKVADEGHHANIHNPQSTTLNDSSLSQASAHTHSDTDGADAEKGERRSFSGADEEKQEDASDPNIVDWD